MGEFFEIKPEFLKICGNTAFEIYTCNRRLGLQEFVRILRKHFKADLSGIIIWDKHQNLNIAFSLPRPIAPKFKSLEKWLKSGGKTALVKLLESGRSVSGSDAIVWVNNPGSYHQFLILFRLDNINSVLSTNAKVHLVMIFDDIEALFPKSTRELHLMILAGVINQGLRNWDEKEALGHTLTFLHGDHLEIFVHQVELVRFIGEILPDVQVELLNNVYSRIFKSNKQLSNRYLSGALDYVPPEIPDALILESATWNKKHLFKSDSCQSIATRLRLIIYWSWWCGADTRWISAYRSKKVDDFEDGIKKEIKKGFDKLEENEKELREFLKDRFLKLTVVAG